MFQSDPTLRFTNKSCRGRPFADIKNYEDIFDEDVLDGNQCTFMVSMINPLLTLCYPSISSFFCFPFSFGFITFAARSSFFVIFPLFLLSRSFFPYSFLFQIFITLNINDYIYTTETVLLRRGAKSEISRGCNHG